MTAPTVDVSTNNDAAIVLIDREIQRIEQIARHCASQVELYETKVREWDANEQEHRERIAELRRAREFL